VFFLRDEAGFHIAHKRKNFYHHVGRRKYSKKKALVNHKSSEENSTVVANKMSVISSKIIRTYCERFKALKVLVISINIYNLVVNLTVMNEKLL
jgi:hypothetical protein